MNKRPDQDLPRTPLEGDWPCVWLDATYLKVRHDGPIVSVAFIIAVGVSGAGRRQVLSDGADLPKPDLPGALAAIRLLGDLLDEFPFAKVPSRSVAFSALITPVVRGALRKAIGISVCVASLFLR